MTHRFRLERASDWPPELRRACDRYETAIEAVANAREEGALTAALAERAAAKGVYGFYVLRLDKQRRPQVYAKECA